MHLVRPQYIRRKGGEYVFWLLTLVEGVLFGTSNRNLDFKQYCISKIMLHFGGEKLFAST